MLIVVAGLPGTGKTSVAKQLAAEIGAVLLSTDAIRRRVVREPGHTVKKRRQVYEELFDLAQGLLQKEKDVILDGTFFRAEWRRRASQLARRQDLRFFLLEIVCPEHIVRRRIERRFKRKDDFSEADFRVHKIMQSRFEPIGEPHDVLDTGDEALWRGRILDLANRMRVMERQEKVIDRLRRERGWRQIQTHISWVLLDGRNAYKIKKPVRLSFLDYSSLRKRTFFCREEVRVNSRLAPDIYLGLAPLMRKGREVEIGGKGRPVEMAVKMRELPQSARMDRLLEKGAIGRLELARVSETICGFHKRARASLEFGSPKSVAENLEPAFRIGDISPSLSSPAEKTKEIEKRMCSFLAKKKKLFTRRVEEKRIRRCHGDLRAQNIFICGERTFILDAVEFNKKISTCDVAADIAFLSMELRYFSRPDLAAAFIKEYMACSGDGGLCDLIDFYECYRALVEALVNAYTTVDPEVPPRSQARARRSLEKYLDLAGALSLQL
jgi:aminoglycoside phosphotransferase family enzyme/predicted kinase